MAKIVEVTNPVTGQPTQVDQLDHTAQQIDDAVARALPGGYYDKWVSQLPGQNLLDNSVFIDGCLVDQRGGYVVPPGTARWNPSIISWDGVTSKYCTAILPADNNGNIAFVEDGVTYSTPFTNCVRGYTGAGYGPDRWKASAGAQSRILIFEDHVAFTNTATSNMLRQDMEKPERFSGKLVTLAMLLESATDGCVTKAYIRAVKKDGTYAHKYSEEVAEKNLAVATLQIPDDIETIYLGCVNSTKTGSTSNVYAASLDLGDHQKHFYQDANGVWQLNALPNYADTLARCQRYQNKIENISGGASIVGWGMVSTTNAIIFSIPLSAPLRNSTPTVIFNRAEYSYGAQYTEIPSDAKISGIRNNGNSVQVVVTFPAEHGLSIGTVVGLRLTNSYGAYVLIDANL